IITEGDMLRWRVRVDWSPALSIVDLMQRQPMTVSAQQNLLQVIELFHQTGRRRLPVVDSSGWLLGLVTQTALLNQMTRSVHSRQAVLNPDDITEPAVWFDPHDDQTILAINRSGCELLGVVTDQVVGQPVTLFASDAALWPAIVVLLQHCHTLGPLQLSIRAGNDRWLCVSCKFQLIDTPTGESRVFWTIQQLDSVGADQRCL
ncbi:MAG: CBS domain-containing protein, partial [Magnetococcales bacterium]|nr:CBS domain-containing protein [Magnetococcales bacterium]